MISENKTLTILGLPLALKAGADTDRIAQAVTMVEDRYEDQVRRSRGALNKEVLLSFLALDLADELLQLQKQQQEMEDRLARLLSYIEESK